MEHLARKHSKDMVKYAKITLKKRMQLVQQVLQQNLLLSKVAKKLNISLSTAKLILKRYKQDGTFFESKAEQAKRLSGSTKTEGSNKQNQFVPPPAPQENTLPLAPQPQPLPLQALHPYQYQNYTNFAYCLGAAPQNTLMLYYF